MSRPPLHKVDLDHVLSHTEGLWQELRGARVFVTGGTGFVGSWLLESLAHANDQLGLHARATVLTRNPEAFAANAPHLADRIDLEMLKGDVRSFPLPDGSFSHVIHAGTTSSAAVEPGEMFATIVDGTRRVLEFASAHGTRKLLFVSSGAVYGRQPSDLTHVSERYFGAPDPLDAASAYGEGKRAAELLCTIANRERGLQTKIARCFTFVGPLLPLDAHFAIGNFVRDALSGGPIHVKGDGTPYRSYLYAADLAVWLWTILFRGRSGQAYNVGSEAAFTVHEIARVVRDGFSCSPPIEIAQMSAAGQSPSRYVPATSKGRTELGLQETVALKEAIRRTVLWHKTQQL